MNADVGNTKMLRAGAQFLRGDGINWQPMSTAPRDGTVVEIKNSYGVAPTYSLGKWTDEGLAHGRDGQMHPFKRDHASWFNIKSGGGWISESSLSWRPYVGDVDSYVDPTGGAQNSMAYWRGAVAAKHGLPLDYFEKQTARNVKNNERRAALHEHADPNFDGNLAAFVVAGVIGLLIAFLILVPMLG